MVSVFGDERLGILGAPGARRVIGKVDRRPRLPGFENGLNDAPGSFHLVGAHEQGGA